MADFNNGNQNGVFGGVGFGENNAPFFGETTPENIGVENGFDKGQKGSLNANSIFGDFGVQNADTVSNTNVAGENFKPIDKQKAITKQGLWSKIRAFLFQEIDLTAPIKVELTPYQQKVEDEINEFLHQEVSFKGISKFFGFKK